MTLTCTYPPCGRAYTAHPYEVRRGRKFCSNACRGAAILEGHVWWRSHGRGKYVWTPEHLALLQRYYTGKSADLAKLYLALPFPPHTIKAKASSLGLTRLKETPWSEQELEYLHTHIGTTALAAIARHLRRTKVAVTLKAKRRGICKRDGDGLGYTLREIERLLGLECHATQRCIRKGWLRASRRHTERTAVQGGDFVYVAHEDLYQLVITHPEVIDLRRVDRDFFLELVTRGASTRAQMRVHSTGD